MDLRNLPYFDEYFGLWCIQPEWLSAAYDRFSKLDLTVHMQSGAPQAAEAKASAGSKFQTAGDSVAVIQLSGPMMKQASSLESGTSTVQARRQVRAAANDPSVGSILLHISSPGGTFSGTADLAADVAAAAKKKPVQAYIEDLGASAAYWVASQAQKIYANPTAFIGSIGTYSTMEDSSKAAEASGVKVHLITTGAYKGMGEDGTQINSDQLAEAQRRINEANEHFIRGVATGRGLSQQRVRELADGRVHMAGPAQKLGLIDGVQSLDETIRQLSQKRNKTMSKENSVVTEPVVTETAATAPAASLAKAASPATLAELESGLPGAEAGFVLSQLKANATLPQAQQAFIAEQSKQLATAKADLEKAKTSTPPAKKPGVKPVSSGDSSGETDAVAGAEDFNAAVRAEMKGGKTRAQAVRSVSKSRPDLHQAYLVSHKQNQRSRVSALINDRFEFAGRSE